MKPRKWMFYVIAILLLSLCGTYLGFYFTTESGNVGAEQDKDMDIADLVPDDEFDDIDQDDEDDAEESIPTDSLELINYGLNIYQNGAGSLANYNYTLYATATTMGMEAESRQYINGRMSYSGGKSLDESFWYYEHTSLNEMLASWGRAKEECQVIYTEKEKDYVAVGETQNMDLNNLTYNFADDYCGEEYNYEKAIDKYKVLWADGFPLPINKNTVKIIRHDSRSNKYYTKITVSYDLNKLPEVFFDYYRKNNGLMKATYTDYEFTFIISKQTGKIKKIIRHEDFYVRIVAKGWDVTMYCKTDCTQDFVKMDKAINIAKPFKTAGK